jgi:hypothetical protein
MTIRCPRCGRDGRLPGKLASPTQILRCRKCQGRFTAHTLQPVGVVPNLERPFGTVPSSEMAGALDRYSSSAALLASLDDEDDLPPTLADLGDSNYELTVSLVGELDDSQFELPTIRETDPSPPANRSAPALVLAGSEPFPPDPEFYALIDSWSRICFLAVLGSVALSLLVIGVLLVRAFLGGSNIHSSTTALIFGFVGTIAFLLVSFMMTVLSLLLVDLARNTRRLRIHADRGAQIASE